MLTWSKVSGLAQWFFRVICIGTMVSASPFAKAQAVPTKSATIDMQPLKSASLVCGVALEMECPSCNENSWIEIAVRSAEEPSRTVHIKRVFTHGALFKNFYNIYFFDRARGAYVTPSDHCIRIPPDANFKVELSSSDTLSLERDSVVREEPNRGSKHAKWLIESYGNPAFGLPLTSMEPPYKPSTAFAAIFFLQVFAILGMVLLAFRGEVSRGQAARVAGLAGAMTLLTFCLYFKTLCIDPVGGDSREFQLLQLGFTDLHQPGDPIMAIFASTFGKYFPVGNFLFKAHLFAAMLASLSIGLVSASLFILTGSWLASVLPAFVLASAMAFWNYGVVAQNYSMAALWQAIMLFFAFNLRRRPNTVNFVLAVLVSFAMLTTHLTSGFWVLFCAATIVPQLRIIPRSIHAVGYACIGLLMMLVAIYAPYLLEEHPNYFHRVVSLIDAGGSDVSLGGGVRKVLFSIEGWHSFCKYVMGNSDGGLGWTGGMIKMIKGGALFASDWLMYLRILGFGFGKFAWVLGFAGLFLAFFRRFPLWVSCGLAGTIAINFVFATIEPAFFHCDYFEIFCVHLFPSYFALTIAMSAILVPDLPAPGGLLGEWRRR